MDISLLYCIYRDKRLAGESLLVPFKKYGGLLSKVIKPLDQTLGLSGKVGEVFKRIAVVLMLPIASATAILLPVGLGVKYGDLARRKDELYEKKPMITTHFPFILEKVSRLGDRLVADLHVRHFSQKAHIRYYYKPFKGEQIFNLQRKEQAEGALVYDREKPLYFKKIIYLKKDSDLTALDNVNPNESVLYVVPYYPESKIERGEGYKGIREEIDWEDPLFKKQNQQLFAIDQTARTINQLVLPKDAYTIAIHMRTGGDFDNADMQTIFPAKLPSKEFYVAELENVILKRIEEMQTTDPEKKNIFIHIFTDAGKPEQLKNKLQAELQRRGVNQKLDEKGIMLTLSFRDKASLAEDFHNMSQNFDCMIRPDSNMSGTIAKFVDYSLEIVPSHYRIDQKWKELVIDEVEYIKRNADGSKAIQKHLREYKMKVVQRWYLPLSFYRWMHRQVLGPKCP